VIPCMNSAKKKEYKKALRIYDALFSLFLYYRCCLSEVRSLSVENCE